MIGMTGRNAATTTAKMDKYAGPFVAGSIRRRVGPVLGVLCLTLALTACGGSSGSGSSKDKDDPPPNGEDPTIEDPTIDPVACFTPAVIGLNVQTDASCSQGENINYTWEWGDGGGGSGVSAQHDYAAAGTYHISLTVSDGERADTVTHSVSVNDSVVEDGERVVNPFHGADAYINPDYAALVETSATQVEGSLAARMRRLAEVPTAVWLDRIEAIHGGEANAGRKSLEQHLDAALAQKREGVPLTASFVVYNLPDRDCAAYASNGTLHADQNGLQRYREEYTDWLTRECDALRNKIPHPKSIALAADRVLARVHDKASIARVDPNRGLELVRRAAEDGTERVRTERKNKQQQEVKSQ